jgi:hypothetical protein
MSEDAKKISPLIYTEMVKRIQSWAVFLLIFGVILLVSTQGEINNWAIALIFSGILSLLFKTRGIFVLNAVIVFWAAFSNITSGNLYWMLFSLIQVYVGISIFRDFHRFKDINHSELLDSDLENIKNIRQTKAEKFIPLLGFLLGSLALVSLIIFYVIMISVTITYEGVFPTDGLYSIALLLVGISQTSSLVAFSMSLSALLCKYPKIMLPILGMICSTLVILYYIISSLFFG